MNKKHLLYILLDGLGDRPIAEFGNRTPLEAANRPNMNALAKKGSSGFVYTVGKGIAPESDVAVISMLGYDPHKTYTGRGPIEVFGSGMTMENGDLAVRCNFATFGSDFTIIDRRCGRSLTTEEARVLADAINSEVRLESHPAEFEFRSTVGHRGVLLIRCKEGKLSGNISNTDPAYLKKGGMGIALEAFENKVQAAEPLDGSDEAKRAAELLNEFTRKSYRVLESHPINRDRAAQGKPPANGILGRDAGSSLPDFTPVTELYGMEFAAMVEMPVERGIALLCGMDSVELPKATGDLSLDYERRAELASELIQCYGGVYIHIKGPDEPAHDGDCAGKRRSIEMIDEHFFGHLKVDLSNTAVVVTADHSTPCSLRAHSDDPVPLIVAGAGIPNDGTGEFGESACRKGSLGEITGVDLLKRVIRMVS
ncbi:MAG: 2,3-bisphosphoglycerate-independent phosphoglycerate mutase [Candidatus Methanosuratincola sp.]|jgi:2,3-bisphosphoglycerate-independent phosphoglycerate mutase|nr:alkaline phosphatase family protein [Candidatus Methanosuratincola sp.]